LFEYQRLLRSKPPHRIDNKTIAIVDILKKRPNLMQKDIIKVLAEDYEITGVTQTSISRYIKRIYDMKKHVDVILQAQKEGFVVL
jgi:arginine repressor